MARGPAPVPLRRDAARHDRRVDPRGGAEHGTLRVGPDPSATAPAAPLAWARSGLGAVVASKAWHLATLVPSLTATGAIRVPYWDGFSPGPTLLTVLCGALAAAGISLAIGWRSRTSAAASSGLLVVALLADRQLYANHHYLLILLTALLALGDCGAAYSLDARRRGGRSRVPRWPITLLRLQVTIVYGFAGLSKLNASYLSGEALRSFVADEFAARWPLELWQALSIASVAGELFLAAGLWHPATRRWAAPLGVAMHAGMVVLIDYPLPLVLFAAEMLLLYPLFFPSAQTIGSGDPSPGATSTPA